MTKRHPEPGAPEHPPKKDDTPIKDPNKKRKIKDPKTPQEDDAPVENPPRDPSTHPPKEPLK